MRKNGKDDPGAIWSSMDVSPYSTKFGLDRGRPIDRYYIERFLSDHQALIRGTVLEVGGPAYTRQFGGERVERSLVLHADAAKEGIDIAGDLETGRGIPEGLADCFILTQTLLCTFNVFAAAGNAVRVLKPGGALLLTAPGITQISRFDYDRWGQYWSFTDQSVKRLFEGLVPAGNVSVMTYGNVKAAAAFLYGLALHEIDAGDLDHCDHDYQMVVAAVVRK